MTAPGTTKENPEYSIALAALIQSIPIIRVLNWRDKKISCIRDDSRLIKPQSLFVAVDGEEQDGHEFIDKAVHGGAAAVVCQKMPEQIPDCPLILVEDSRKALSALASHFYATNHLRLKPIGITGTDGKTTTAHLICQIIRCSGGKAGMLGTLEYDLGERRIESNQTTPHPLALHSMLREMELMGMTHAVMEVSSHGLVHHRLNNIDFDIAVLTNLTEDHLDFHGSKEEYIKAKQMLFQQLAPEAIAILNADCPVWKRYCKNTQAEVLTYGIKHNADVKLLGKKSSISGTSMRIRTPLEVYDVDSPLVGDFNCENILAAATVGFAAGIESSALVEAFKSFSGVPGRLEKINGPAKKKLPSFFVDYAHTPDALQKILLTMKPLTRGQLICVFGCGGNRERQKRPKMGHIATSVADMSIITSDNSRGERSEDIIEDITRGIFKSTGRYITEPDRRKAIEKAWALSNSKDDVIVVCGKGAERFQQIGETKIPFDDRDVCREVMKSTERKKKTA